MLIYVDMDGVLSDLDGYLADYAEVPLHRIKFDREFRAGVVRKSFNSKGLLHWHSLKPLDRDFWHSKMREWHEAGHRIEILTSYGSWDPLHVSPMAHMGKTTWMRTHYGDLFEAGVISGFNGVEQCGQKGFFAERGALLVDDQEENCEDFICEGGEAVLYRTPEDVEGVG
jgi:hypothetical protein